MKEVTIVVDFDPHDDEDWDRIRHVRRHKAIHLYGVHWVWIKTQSVAGSDTLRMTFRGDQQP